MRKSNKYLSKPIFKNRFLSRKSHLFFVVFSIALLKSGIWVFPAINSSFVISQQPFTQPFSDPDEQYLITTWFASYFAHVLGIKSLASFIILHFVFAFSAVYLLFRFIRESVEPLEQGKALILFAMLPAVSTIFYWVGMDSFTFLIMVLFLNFKNRLYFILFIGIIGGLHHFEILIISAISLCLFEIIKGMSKVRLREILPGFFFLIGIILGKIILFLIFEFLDVKVSRNRVSIGLDGLKSNLELISKYGFLIYWSMLGVVWLVLIFSIFKRNRDSLALVVSLLIPMTVVFFVRDSSRVIQLTSFLTISIGLLSNKLTLKNISIKHIKLISILWLLIPWVWIWQKVFGSNTLFTFRYVLSRLFDNDLAPRVGNIFMWPFS